MSSPLPLQIPVILLLLICTTAAVTTTTTKLPFFYYVYVFFLTRADLVIDLWAELNYSRSGPVQQRPTFILRLVQLQMFVRTLRYLEPKLLLSIIFYRCTLFIIQSGQLSRYQRRAACYKASYSSHVLVPFSPSLASRPLTSGPFHTVDLFLCNVTPHRAFDPSSHMIIVYRRVRFPHV